MEIEFPASLSRNIMTHRSRFSLFFLVLFLAACSTATPAASETALLPSATNQNTAAPTKTITPSQTPGFFTQEAFRRQTATVYAATARWWTPTISTTAEPPTAVPTATLLPSRTPTYDPRGRVTITPAAAAVCPPIKAEYQPVFPDQKKEDESASGIDVRGPLLEALNQGASLAALRRAVSRITEDGKPANIPAEAIYAKDVTGDGVPEVIFSSNWLVIYTCKAGEYAEVLEWNSGIGRYLRKETITDMDQDGLNEIVVSLNEIFGFVSNNYFGIYRWNGREFVDLFESQDINVPGDAKWKVQDVDGNGLLELVVRTNQDLTDDTEYHGPWRIETYTYAWNGMAYVLQPLRLDPPEYRFQAVQDGDRAMRSEEYTAAIAFFRQAIEDPRLKGWGYSMEHIFQRREMQTERWQQTPTQTPLPLDPSEKPTLAAYAHYRMIVAYAALGEQDKALSDYQALQAAFPAGRPGRIYAELARVFWEKYQAEGKLDAGCQAVLAFAEKHEEEVLQPLKNYEWGFQNLHYEVWDLCKSGT